MVKGRAAKTGYDWDQFGHCNVDVDRNRRDTASAALTSSLL